MSSHRWIESEYKHSDFNDNSIGVRNATERFCSFFMNAFDQKNIGNNNKDKM